MNLMADVAVPTRDEIVELLAETDAYAKALRTALDGKRSDCPHCVRARIVRELSAAPPWYPVGAS